MRTDLLIIDPQNDFCISDDAHGNRGALVVPGAAWDMARVAEMIARLGHRLWEIHVTMDMHHSVGIERPGWWKRVKDGAAPPPFTTLMLTERGDGIVDSAGDSYTTSVEARFRHGPPTGHGALGYARALKAHRASLTIWPEHCEIGTWGACVVSELAQALRTWEQRTGVPVEYVFKGINPYTEHFSAIQAEVPDPTDRTTTVDRALLDRWNQADLILVAGEARSHCVNATGWDLLAQCPKIAQKLVLLEDATHDVPGFEKRGDKFMEDMLARGVRIGRTTQEEW